MPPNEPTSVDLYKADRMISEAIAEIKEEILLQNQCAIPGESAELNQWYINRGAPVLFDPGYLDSGMYFVSQQHCRTAQLQTLIETARADMAEERLKAEQILIALVKQDNAHMTRVLMGVILLYLPVIASVYLMVRFAK